MLGIAGHLVVTKIQLGLLAYHNSEMNENECVHSKMQTTAPISIIIHSGVPLSEN